jgi:hypothetical protein
VSGPNIVIFFAAEMLVYVVLPTGKRSNGGEPPDIAP